MGAVGVPLLVTLMGRCCFVVGLFAAMSGGGLSGQEARSNSASEPMNWTSVQDHQKMMDQLGIKSLRPGRNGNPAAGGLDAANYDPAKANPYPNLPDPLTLKNGRKVSSAEMWWKLRRPEIVEDFQREVYGRV